MSERDSLHKLRQRHVSGEVPRNDLREVFAGAASSLEEIRASLKDSMVKSILVEEAVMTMTFESGVKLAWLTDDLGSAASVAFSDGAYEREETALMSALARGKKTFLDVGANVGWFSLHIAQVLDGIEPCVIALEPIERNFETLKRNIALNGLESVIRPFNVGAGENAGAMTFTVPSAMPGAASLQQLHPDCASEQQRCTVISLDDFLRRERVSPIDVMKCDVEGAELMVVKGAREMLKRDRPIILFELLRKWSRAFGYHPNEVFAELLPLGYQAFAIGKGEVRSIAEIDELTLETNFLFLCDAHAAELRLIQDFTTLLAPERSKA